VDVSPIKDTGPVSTTTAGGPPKTVTLASLNEPFLATSLTALTDTVSTVPGTATGSSSAVLDSLLGTLEGSTVIKTTSSTTCTNGSLSYAGSTTLAALSIGGTKIVGPAGSGALVTTPIPPNTTLLNVPGIAKLVLNEQEPLEVGGQQEGLIVNAIDLTVNSAPITGSLNTVSGEIVIGHSESDIESGCS
jgi:hypothetical protein